MPQPAQDAQLYPSPAKPLYVARRLTSDIFTRGEALTLHWWRGNWYMFTGTHFRKVTDELDLRAPLWEQLSQVYYPNRDGEPTPWPAESHRVNGLIEPLKITTRLPVDRDAPFFVSDPTQPAKSLIAMNNGILDYRARTFTDSTPDLFTTWALPFDYDPNAQCPKWESFLKETFAHDENAILTIQELFGYLMTNRTDMQVGWLFIGPSGSGKGVIIHILKALIGSPNIAAGSFATLSNRFGIAEWVGKSLAIFGDARDNGAINETASSTLLSVIGQDAVPVEAKNKDIVTMTLPTRVVIVSNELPSFKDPSKALSKRWIITETQKGLRGTGKEDKDLATKLEAEIAGILNWALEGLDRLETQGKFTSPTSSEDTREMLNDSAAPETQFIEDNYRFTYNNSDFLYLSEVYARYEQWITQRRMKPTSQNTFKKRIKAAGLPGVVVSKRPNALGERKEAIIGIAHNAQITNSTDSTQLNNRFHPNSN